jgi:hypothetical protein
MVTMINATNEINTILNLIKTKTNITIPDIIHIEETDRMRERKSIAGTYWDNRISINPNIFDIHTDREYYREKAEKEIIYINGKHSRIDTEDKLTEYMNNVIKNTILWRVHYVIAHECGHYVHDKYFGNLPQRIPIKDGFGTHGMNSRKNPRENFADGFAEYVLDLFWKADSKRAKRMNALIKKIQPFI